MAKSWFVLMLSLFGGLGAKGVSITLAWDASVSPAVATYGIVYGVSSHVYTSSIDAGTNTTFTLSGLTPGHTYYCAVSGYDAAGNESLYSPEVSNNIPPPPVITFGPFGRTVAAGAAATLSVAVMSSLPVTYQWYGAALLPGATNSSLTLPATVDADAGNYTVVVANSSGSVTSSAATLVVLGPPVIAVQPQSQTAGAGGSVVLHAGASGTGLAYQWFLNGTPIAGATTKGLYLVNLTAANAGLYYMTAQNAAGTASSATAMVTVTNVFDSVAGAYNGLFYQTNGQGAAISVAAAGLLGNCVVGAAGVYSARVYIGGFTYPLMGALNASGGDSEVVNRSANGLPSLAITLNVDMTGVTGLISGSVSNMSADNPWIAPLAANLATNALPVPAGNFSMSILPPAIPQNNSPNMAGTVMLINAGGVVTCMGVLADGTFISQSMPLSATGVVPLYFSLYGGLGLAEGWVSLAGGQPAGSITWIRPAGVSTANPFPQGFTNSLTIN